MPKKPENRGGYLALEAVGMVITSLSAQAVIRGFFNSEYEPIQGIFSRVPGGFSGQMILLAFMALAGTLFGGWAHIRQEPGTERAGNPGGIRRKYRKNMEK
ncbi:hypothetical protein [Streptomyces sp. MP131-18]|uniref:hypothetical protein n=1 Tax=Streptomyces sp. MP131-18 TaxID=1857892 RepID=UPI00117FC39F|nr:hypothetical protein [Streptomyces sp. MP131-18]